TAPRTPCPRSCAVRRVPLRACGWVGHRTDHRQAPVAGSRHSTTRIPVSGRRHVERGDRQTQILLESTQSSCGSILDGNLLPGLYAIISSYATTVSQVAQFVRKLGSQGSREPPCT